jgi:hypothetical protein
MPVTVKPFKKPAEGPAPAVDSKKNPVKAGGKKS